MKRKRAVAESLEAALQKAVEEHANATRRVEKNLDALVQKMRDSDPGDDDDVPETPARSG